VKNLGIRSFAAAQDDLLSTGAQVTFFLLLSLSPFLVFLITLIAYMPFVNFQDHIEVLAAFMPANAYETLRDIVSQIIANRSGTLLSFLMII
jgi:membrane protein